MRNKWIHLQTLFLWAQPELLLENLRNKTSYPHLRIHAAASCGGGAIMHMGCSAATAIFTMHSRTC